uniref:DDE-1 domain-containing protein n=1 Tax=Clastoptera arizonana TaxID=38151 RepID=A0A1B6CLM7_9HEMI
MVCSNASVSHKLKLLVIGKSKKPRSFKGTRAENLPVHYFNKKKGWIDQQIFKEWFEKKCIPEVKEHLRSKNLPRKTILLIGNAPSQPGENVLRSESGQIFAS